jgi:hypothetical protein
LYIPIFLLIVFLLPIVVFLFGVAIVAVLLLCGSSERRDRSADSEREAEVLRPPDLAAERGAADDAAVERVRRAARRRSVAEPNERRRSAQFRRNRMNRTEAARERREFVPPEPPL